MAFPFARVARIASAAKAVLALAACLACGHAAGIAPPALVPATEADSARFDAWYASAYPDQPAVSRMVRSRSDGVPVDATVVGQVRRAARALCVAQQRRFVYESGWKLVQPGLQVAWLEKAGCTAHERGVPTDFPMPETDLLELLERSERLLASARLLFAGNTECARLRAYPFALAGIGVSAPVRGGETMARLVFLGRQGMATVWVRRSGLEYTAWNVACRRS